MVFPILCYNGLSHFFELGLALFCALSHALYLDVQLPMSLVQLLLLSLKLGELVDERLRCLTTILEVDMRRTLFP